jgi:histidyl-tRNA synthetase
MAEKTPPRIPSGMRDILPDQMLRRQYVIDVVRATFEEFGFEPLETPAIELSETLTGKYGPEAERLIYKAWYGGEAARFDEFSLRYDLSVPLSRVVAMYPDLPRPFKRYQIAPVWRADRPQKGRYRQFYQCDVDTVGSASMLADAEVVCVTYEVLNRLGFSDFVISINNRKILNGIGQYAGVPAGLLGGLYRSIDKLEKIGREGVERELLMVGIPEGPQVALQRAIRLALQGKLPRDQLRAHLLAPAQGDEALPPALVDGVVPHLERVLEEAAGQDIASGRLQAISVELAGRLAPPLRDYFGAEQIIPDDVVRRLLDLLSVSGDSRAILDGLACQLQDYPEAVEGIEELREMIGYLDDLGIPAEICKINFWMVRGLEYYTGPIYETSIREPKAMPSIVGGGRYDDLIGMFMDHSYPATGLSLGIERIIDAMEELDMFPADIRATTAEVLMTAFNRDTLSESLKLANALRKAGLNTAMYFDYQDRLGDQIGYASAKGIPFVVILGPDEIATGQATVRRLGRTAEEAEERVVARDRVVDAIKNW